MNLEEKEMKPWMKVLVFLGMLVVSAIICAVIWHFTHLDKTPGETMGQTAETTATPVATSTPEATGTPAPTSTPEATSTPVPTSTPEATSTPAPTSTPEPTSTPAPTSTPEATATPETAVTQAPSNESGADGTMVFAEVQELVTPKDVINLRSVPTTSDAANIVTQAHNGEQLTRIGVNTDTGWSKISYNGQILYGVSQYLTTDLTYKTPTQTADPNRISTMDGRVIVFVDCDDWISPKEYVNLRTEPSTTEGDSTVSCQLYYGEKVHRTGYSADSGWSRVEYNGQVLYVVSSYMNVVEE